MKPEAEDAEYSADLDGTGAFLVDELADILERSNGHPRGAQKRETLNIASVVIELGLPLSPAVQSFIARALAEYAEYQPTGKPKTRRKVTDLDVFAVEYLMARTGRKQDPCVKLLVEFYREKDPARDVPSPDSIKRRHRDSRFRLRESEVRMIRAGARVGNPVIDDLLTWEWTKKLVK